MRKVLFLILYLFSLSAMAQPAGDEWINFDQQYWRIPVAEDGIYRVNYSDLQSAGFPVATIDPRRIQMFFQGNEIAIEIEGQDDARFDPGDFILFYGSKNDGKVDSYLYSPSAFQPHDLYSIYTDTSAYFLTYALTPLIQGRRITSYKENNTGGLPAETATRKILTQLQTDEYAPGVQTGPQNVVTLTAFDQGEGWSGRQFQEGESTLVGLNGLTQLSAGGSHAIEVLIQGRDDLTTHVAEVLVGPDALNLRSLGTVSFPDFEFRKFTAPIVGTDISAAGEISVQVRCLGLPGENDRISVSYVRAFIDKQPDMQNRDSEVFRFTASSGNKVYMEIENVPSDVTVYDISDPVNISEIGFNTSGTDINAIIRNADTQRTLFVTNAEQAVVLNPVTFRDIDFSEPEYVILTHRLLRSPAGGFSDPVAAYAAYRASAEGGGYDTLVMNMRTLYDQYSYGVTTPLAIYNFVRKLVAQGNPQYLFLIGKGLEPQHNFYRNSNGYFEDTKFGVTYQIRDLVPSAGQPGSDIAFSAGLGGTLFEPAVPTGRIPAVNAGQVAAYLTKVREMESQPYNDLYRKTLLHLSGGISQAELVLFRRFMDSFGATAIGPLLGGTFNTIQKDNTSTIELINISDEVNSGVGLITFFGHSAPSVTDIDIGFVSDPSLGYNNLNKYPMFLVNGCQAGQFFLPQVIFGEDWINASDKGAIGFIAHSSFGFSGGLRRYSDLFYRTAFEDSLYFSKSVGLIQQETSRKFQDISNASPQTITQIQQMVLLGDPATPMYNTPLPDYATNDNVLTITTPDGTPATSRTPELALNIVTSNYGRTDSDSLHVRVIRTLNNNTQLTYDSVYTPVFFQDTLTMILPNSFSESAGNNIFEVFLDPDNLIDELNESNNSGRLEFFLPSFATRNILPADYGIVEGGEISLITQSTNLFGEERSFSFELDTARDFSSPVRISGTATGRTVAVFDAGDLPLFGSDSITYFWRTRYTQPSEDESDEWQLSSFSIINGTTNGWTQRVYHQFDENELTDMVRFGDNRSLEFTFTTLPYSVFTAGDNNPLTNEEVSVQIDNVEYNIDNQYCRDNTLNFIAFNRNTAVPYLGIPLPSTNSRTCGRQPQVINSFSSSQINAAANGVTDYINAIPEGDPVSFFSIGRVNYSSFSAGVLNSLAEIGVDITDIASWANGEPVIVYGRKGATAGQATVVRTTDVPANDQEISQDTTVIGSLDAGYMKSTLIGPAQNWQTLKVFSKKTGADSFMVDVAGVSLEGDETVLFADVTDMETDLSGVDAARYPYLRLTGKFTDPQDRTAPQLQWWQADFTPVPEGVLLVRDAQAPPVVVQEGVTLENTFDFVNLSGLAFSDSLTVRYRLVNTTQGKSIESFFRIDAPSDTTTFSVNTTTNGFAGLNNYSVWVNPRIIPEQDYDNNRFDEAGYLRVSQDDMDPVIDVTFDGAYILDGDIVSPSPLISIVVRDENKVLPKTDTTGIIMNIRENCDGCEERPIYFGSDFVEWHPATAEEPFRIEYKSPKLGDGIYTFGVQAEDASGNQAGEEPYSVNFEVINESTISNFYPYPNPFSTSTRFVFTLTGSYVPDNLKIQILTVTGRVVREIMMEELGPIRIGNNITEYAWDGRDEFGDQLANGVYLYRVILDTGSNSIKHRSTAGDKAFDKGYGKLYILR